MPSTRFLFIPRDNKSAMGESNDRLKSARKKAGFASARSAANRFGWIVSTYASHENGQTPVPVDAAEVYGRAYKVSPGWILTGDLDPTNYRIIKVMGRVGTGSVITPEEEQVPPEGLSQVDVPFPLPEDAIAFEVDGTSMLPRYEAGDLVVCLNRYTDPELLIGRQVVVKTGDGKRYLKKLRQGRKKGTFDLESFNADPIEGVKVAWAAEVRLIVPGPAVRR